MIIVIVVLLNIRAPNATDSYSRARFCKSIL